MATCDHPTDLVHRIAYPSRERSGARIDSRFPAFLADEERELPVDPQQRNEVGNIFYVIESRPRNPWSVIGSLAFLTVIVLAAIVVPLLHTDPLPKREMLTMLYLQPPPASAASSRRLEAPKPTSSYTPTSTAMLSPVHKAEQAPPPPADTMGGVVGGVPGGMVGGVSGGVLTEMPTSARSAPILAKSPEPMPVKRMRVASRVAEANLIHDVPPQYPTEAGRARIEGTVVLMAVIGTDGTVKDVRIESGLPLLAQAAIDAVKQWRYKPYVINGEPVEVDSRITINFNLSTS